MRVYREDIRKSGASELALIFHHDRRAWIIPSAKWLSEKPSGVYSYDEIQTVFRAQEGDYDAILAASMIDTKS